MSETCILLVDDEPDLIWAIQRSLTFAGYGTLTAKDGIEALSIARRHFRDLVILDINMPGLDGLEVCRQIRQDPALSSTPILFLTHRGATIDRINGLDEGGDDYLAKPFDLLELKAHIRALLRRNQKTTNATQAAPANQSVLAAGPMTLDAQSRQVYLHDQVIQLTSTEFDLLYFLMVHPSKVFSSKQLLQQVWNYPPETGDPSLVRWHMKNLRAKLEADPSHPTYLRSVARQGYMLERRQNPH